MGGTDSLNDPSWFKLALAGVASAGIVALMWRKARVPLAAESRSNDDEIKLRELALIQRESYSMLSESLSAREDAKTKLLPCTLLCGPLGSGKTTTLRHLLKEIRTNADFKCAAIVNDFADLGVDVELIQHEGNDPETSLTYGMSEGCCCCVNNNGASDNLSRVLSAMRSKRFDVDCVIVETSGLSEAAGARAQLSQMTRLDSVIGVLDANAFPPSGWTETNVESFVQTCDTIVVNKADVCSTSELDRVTKMMKEKGARDVRLVKYGKIPLPVAFRTEVFEAERGAMGTSLEERKSSRRYRLYIGDDSAHSSQSGGFKADIVGSHLSNVSWTILEHVSSPVASLSLLQDLVFLWDQQGTIERVKGKVWVHPHEHPFEFQYSGRCRLQLSASTAHRGTKRTRLAIVSRNVKTDMDATQRVGLFSTIPHETTIAQRVQQFREWINGNSMVSVLSCDDPFTVRFTVNCYRKFGFDNETLQTRFGVDVSDVNREFHSRCNCAAGPLLIAFDGKDCFVSPGIHLDIQCMLATLEQELESTVSSKFSVVKRHCRCDA